MSERQLKNSLTKADVRYEAIRILRNIAEKGVYARELLEERCSSLHVPKRDKNLLVALVNGVIRQQLSLDTIISFFAKTPFNKIEPWILYALRLGIYQIIYLDKIPISAAVNTSVSLVKKTTRRTDAAKFTNAVLRSVERSILNKSVPEHEVQNFQHALYRKADTWCAFRYPIFPGPEKNITQSIARNYSHPEWLIQRWIRRYKVKQTIEICKSDNTPPPLFLRINHEKMSVREFKETLDKEGIPSKIIHDAVTVRDASISEIPGFSEGWFFVQDLSAMKVARFLKVEKLNTVLDLCAAPGGKMTHIAELLHNTGSIYALDISLKRLRLVRENCMRMRIKNVYSICGDASENKAPFKEKFDRVLVDVPCSNTGVLSRRVEARWRLKEADIYTFASLQYSILKTGISLLKDDGYLVYSTCSIEPEENQGVIKKFLEDESGFYLDAEESCLPGKNEGDGGYMARIKRR